MKKIMLSLKAFSLKRSLFFIVLTSIFCSCSIEPPQFRNISTEINVFATGTNSREERLSFFASVYDQDGTNDIEYLYIVNDKDEIFWTLSENNWNKRNEGETVWIGSNGLKSSTGIIPRGKYRAILVDLSGERDERTFSISETNTDKYKIPVVVIDEKKNAVSVKSDYLTNTAFFLDGGNNVVYTVPIEKGTNVLDNLWADRQWATKADYIIVYGFDTKAGIGFFSWKTRLPD